MKKIIVIQGTHWDYEWYFTNNNVRVLANFDIKEIIKAFKDKKLQHFILDGQTSFLEEYLEDHPEDKEIIGKLMLSGKIMAGPWFSQTDQMIISGENIVKNLQTGINFANKLGKSWNIGYIPDAFGQSQDLPKILNGFAIDKIIFWRGKKGNEREFIFKSNDGSSVDAYNIKEGYYYGGAIYWENEKVMIAELDKLFSQSKFEEIVVSVSGDQRYVDLDIDQKLFELNKKFPNYKFELGTYEEIFEKYSGVDLSTYTGEFLDAENNKIHRSIYSNRYDLKHLNHRIENKIINNLEPLLVLTANLNIETHEHLMKMIWKNVLINSAHDSAGGCNSDKTNRNIKNRFIQSEELADSYVDMLIRKIAETVGKNNDIFIFNTVPYITNKLHKLNLYTKQKNFKLFDNEKQEIDYYISSQEHVYCGSIKRDSADNEKGKYYYATEIYLKKELQPLSYEIITLVEEGPNNNFVLELKSKVIENAYFKISIENNEITLLDKINNLKLNNFIEIVSDADDGDLYDWSPLEKSSRNHLLINEQSIKNFNFEKYVFLEFEVENIVSSNLEEFIKNRKTLNQKFKVHLFLNDKWLNIKIKTNNQSTDARWRIIFNSKINYNKSIADTPFGFIERPIIQKELANWKELGWKEEPTGIYPLLSNLIAKDKNSQLSFILNGIKEYELKDEGKIEITLFRSNSFLGKPNLLRRPGVASGQEFKYVPTNDAKLHQNLNFELNLSFNKLSLGELKKITQIKNTKDIYYQNQELNRFTGPVKYFVSNKLDLALPEKKQIIKENNLSSDLVISIIKQVKDSLVLRIYNPNENDVKENGEIIFTDNYLIYETNLLEKTEDLLVKEATNKLLIPDFRKGQIKTFILEKKKG